MSKKILAIYYTQSGQLADIVTNFIKPFEDAGHTVEKVCFDTVKKFSFPWSSASFFDAMPESVNSVPTPLEPFQFKETSYDLIVLGYQPWFLSPSIPTTSLLVNEQFKKIAANTPVVTLIGARNMWINAQERVKKSLAEMNAKLVGNVALFDRHNNSISAVTIMYWAFTGKKDKMLGIFPKPGISDADIANVTSHGKIAVQHLQQNTLDTLQQDLVANKAIDVKTNLMFVEGRAEKLFAIWAGIVTRAKNRKRALVIYKYYLIIALFLVAPIFLLIYRVLFAPFLMRSIKKQKQYFSGVK